MSIKKTNILIVGAGKGGTALIKLFTKSEEVNVIGVVDVNPGAPGISLAKDLGIPTSGDYGDFLRNQELDEIIDVTGSDEVRDELIRSKPDNVEIMGGHSSKLMWSLVAEQQKFSWDLQESEKKYRAIFDLSPEAIVILDAKGTVLNANKRMTEWLGYQLEEFIGKSITEMPFLGKQAKAMAMEQFSKRISGEKIPPYEINFSGKNGKELVGQVIAATMKNESNENAGEMVIISDVTERRKAENELRDSEERLRILFEYAPVGYYLSDLKGTFIDGNMIAEKITGYKKEELIGKNFLRSGLLETKDIPKAFALLAKNVMGKATGPDEFTMKRKDGKKIQIEISTHPVKIKGRTLVLGIARDITELKRQRELLDQANKELKQKVEALEDAATHIKRLEGLVPICANCKKVRIEGKDSRKPEGWTTLEEYISDKTDASLTHGLCPECMKKLYGDKLKKK